MHVPKRKFIPPSEWARQPKPHARTFPPGLWWARLLSPDQTALVFQRYLQRRGKRGSKKTPHDFLTTLEAWISELTTNQGRRGNVAYWTEKGYAVAHRIKPYTFMARLRTLEAVAKELYPARVPVDRLDKKLTEKMIESIHADYLHADYTDRKAVKKIAAKYGIGTFRVGQLCRKEKEQRRETYERTREKAEAESQPQINSFLSEEIPF
jgi:hypothetical protein